MPSYLKVMGAEQTLLDNYIYETGDGSSAAGLAGGQKKTDDSSEPENENSIP